MVQPNIVNHFETSQTQRLMSSFVSLCSFPPPEGRTMVVSVDPGTTVVVSRDPGGLECDVCTADGSTTPDCSPTEKTLTNVDKLSLEFSCPKPQDMYSVKMKKKIGETIYFTCQQDLGWKLLRFINE